MELLKTKKESICLALFAAFLVLNFITLQYSRIAWYDECYMADYTHNLLTQGKLQNTTNPLTLDYCIYGPIYFLLTGAITKLTGFHPFTFRLLNLICFFCCAGIMFLIMKMRKVDSKIIVASISIYLLDILNLRNSDSGRMDFVALLFVLMAYYVYFKNINNLINVIKISLLLTLAVLTTPRVAAIALPIASWMSYKLMRSKKTLDITLYCLIPVTFIFSWIYIDFGSIGTFFDYIFYSKGDINRNTSVASNYIGGNYVFEWYHLPILCLFIALFFLSLSKTKRNDKFLFVLPIVSYYILVTDTGMYGVFFLPFVFLYISETIQSESLARKIVFDISKCIALIMIVVNCSAYFFKVTTTLSSINQRDEILSEKYISSLIPKGSIVIADYAHYYAVVNNGCVFKSHWQESKSYQTNINELKLHCEPQYIIIGTDDDKANESYTSNFNCTLIGKYQPTPSCNYINNLYSHIRIRRLKHFLNVSYSCNIYKIEQ